METETKQSIQDFLKKKTNDKKKMPHVRVDADGKRAMIPYYWYFADGDLGWGMGLFFWHALFSLYVVILATLASFEIARTMSVPPEDSVVELTKALLLPGATIVALISGASYFVGSLISFPTEGGLPDLLGGMGARWISHRDVSQRWGWPRWVFWLVAKISAVILASATLLLLKGATGLGPAEDVTVFSLEKFFDGRPLRRLPTYTGTMQNPSGADLILMTTGQAFGWELLVGLIFFSVILLYRAYFEVQWIVRNTMLTRVLGTVGRGRFSQSRMSRDALGFAVISGTAYGMAVGVTYLVSGGGILFLKMIGILIIDRNWIEGDWIYLVAPLVAVFVAALVAWGWRLGELRRVSAAMMEEGGTSVQTKMVPVGDPANPTGAAQAPRVMSRFHEKPDFSGVGVP